MPEVALVEAVLTKTPEPWRGLAIKHRELLKFAVVGGSCWLLTMLVWYGLEWTILPNKPITAQVIGRIVAMIVSYVLSREWSFRTRGGRPPHHEAALFFLIAGIAAGLACAPSLVSRYLLELQTPHVTVLAEELADFIAGGLIGTIIQTTFRFWAIRKWVFPRPGARAPHARPTSGPRRGRVSETTSRSKHPRQCHAHRPDGDHSDQDQHSDHHVA